MVLHEIFQIEDKAYAMLKKHVLCSNDLDIETDE